MKTMLEEMAQPFLLRIIEENKETLKSELDKIWEQKKDKIKLDGFREGKVPQNIAEAKLGFQNLYEPYINGLIVNSIKQAEKENNCTIVDIQQVYPEHMSKNSIVMQAVTYLKPSVSVDYSNLQIEKKETKVLADTVKMSLEQTRETHALMMPITDRGVEYGDTINVSFVGSINGVPFKGGTVSRQQFTLEEKSFIPGFGEQVLGMNPEEKKTFNVTFPEDYGVEQLKNKEASFDLTVHEITRKDLPALDDEFAKTCGYDTYTELFDATASDLSKRQEQLDRAEMETALVTQLLSKADIKPLPEVMIKRYLDQMLNQQLNQIGMTEEEFYKQANTDRNTFDKQYYTIAKRDLKTQLILDYIARNEGFTVSDEEYENYLKSESNRSGHPLEELKKAVTKESATSRVLMNKAYDYLLNTAKYVSNEEEIYDGETLESEII